MKNETCNHTLGYTEVEKYDCLETSFISMNDKLKSIKELNTTNGYKYHFCPYCGEKLEGVIELKIKELEKEANNRKKYEEKEKKKREAIFQQKVDELAIKTGLNLLPETGSFIVIFHPFLPFLGDKDYIIAGSKKEILANCIHITHQEIDARDRMSVKTIYKTPTITEFSDQMINKFGFKQKQGTNFVFERTIDNDLFQEIVYDPEVGSVYAKSYRLDDDFKLPSTKLSLARLHHSMKIDIQLEQVVLG